MAEEEAIKRIMPHSMEAEMSVIGSMLMDQQAISAAMEILHPEDFYSRQYGIMFETMTELELSGMAVDPVTLQNRLREKNLPPETYDNAQLASLLAQVPTSANIVSYAKIVAEKALLRRLIRVNEQIAQEGYQESESAEDLLKRSEEEIFRLSQNTGSRDFLPIRDIVINAIRKIEAASKIKNSITGIASGFTDLDRSTAGFQPSDFILIAARPSMGKTALALNIAQNVAMRTDKHVAIFSLEMSREQLATRLFSMESHVDSQKIRTGNMTDGEWEDLIEGAEKVGSSNLILDDTAAISVAEMRSRCLKFKMDMGLDMIIIDYLQLMSGSGKRASESRQQEISDISRSLKSLARELEVPIIALSQLSRAVEQRPDKRPMLSDLRESGAIEQDADLVMFIYRDDYYHPEDSEEKGIAEVIIAKQRNGPTGKVKLKWLPELTKFANLAGAQGAAGASPMG